MPRSLRFEEVGGLRLPVGGVNSFVGVRGRQGRKMNMYQGVSPSKHHRTGPKVTAKEAAVALALLRRDLVLWFIVELCGKNQLPPAVIAAPNLRAVGSCLGFLLWLPWDGIPTVAAALLSRLVAAVAAARGVAVAFAWVRAWRALAVRAPASVCTRLGGTRAIGCGIGLHICGICDMSGLRPKICGATSPFLEFSP